jgi:broad specificity phosphatase PhoE
VKRRLFLATAVVALGAAAGVAKALAQGDRRARVYVLRHFDTPAGASDPDLTERGQARAQALVAWLGDRALGALYVSSARRARQTAAPLADARGMAATLYDPRDTDALIRRVRGEAGPVLIVGHSNTVPDIVEALGGERPEALSHEDFGDVWIVEGGRAERFRVEP